MMRQNILRLVVAALGLVGGANTARADILPSTQVNVLPGGGAEYKYTVTATSDVKIYPGDSFTIFDFAGYSGVHYQPADWTFSAPLTGPVYGNIVPPDSATLVNLTWTYTGADPISTNATSLFLGFFGAISNYTGAGSTVSGWFNSSSHRNDDVVVFSETRVARPTELDNPPTSNTPEPTALALAGICLPLVGAYRRWRRRTAA